MKFQQDFLLGAATAAYQVEGNNIHSDTWVEEHLPHSDYKELSGVAVDHYHRYREDIDLLKDAGLNAYRFSIEWSRIEPECGVWDEQEIRHYREVLSYCLDRQITPVVTLFHFTSPAWLITKCGWESEEVVPYFTRYCRKMAEEYGNLMEYVCTINEANMRRQITEILKGLSEKADNVQMGLNLSGNGVEDREWEKAEAFGIEYPGNASPFISPCTPQGERIVLKAHQAAREAMKQVNPNLKIGLTLSLFDIQAMDGGEARAQEEWDKEFLSYLSGFEQDDFLGIQCYTRKIYDAEGVHECRDSYPRTQMGYENYPMAVSNVVRKAADSFHRDLLITENGIATADDKERCAFVQAALEGIQQCIADGLPVKGYFYWSLLDNYEWQMGYDMQFGLIGVDRTSQARKPRKSLSVLGDFLQK